MDSLTLYADAPLDLVVPPGPLDARVLRVEPPLYLVESEAERVARIVYRAQGIGLLTYDLNYAITQLVPAAGIISYDET